jgi:hypothetical protein
VRSGLLKSHVVFEPLLLNEALCSDTVPLPVPCRDWPRIAEALRSNRRHTAFVFTKAI